MKLVYSYVLTLALFSFLFLGATNIFADCGQKTVDPSTGLVGTTFRIDALDCTSDITATTYKARVYKADGTQLGDYPLSSGGAQLYALVSNLPAGSYYAALVEINGSGNIYVAQMSVTTSDASQTTKFECQSVNDGDYCFKCLYQGTSKISCSTPTTSELSSCPSQCKNIVPGGGGGGGTVTNANIQGSCATAGSVDTAIGCIPVGDLNSFAAFFLRWGMGIAGGIGMLFLVYASFQIITSQGDPKRLQTGRELLTSAISGIILLVFSVFILRILGVNVLGIF